MITCVNWSNSHLALALLSDNCQHSVIPAILAQLCLNDVFFLVWPRSLLARNCVSWQVSIPMQSFHSRHMLRPRNLSYCIDKPPSFISFTFIGRRLTITMLFFRSSTSWQSQSSWLHRWVPLDVPKPALKIPQKQPTATAAITSNYLGSLLTQLDMSQPHSHLQQHVQTCSLQERKWLWRTLKEANAYIFKMLKTETTRLHLHYRTIVFEGEIRF